MNAPEHRRSFVARALDWSLNIAILAVTLLCLAWLAPSAFGYSRYVITGGSMAGTYDKGSVVFEEPVPVEDLEVGDVITYQPPADAGTQSLVTHRIIAIELLLPMPPEPRLQGAKGFADELAKSVGNPSPELPKDPLWEIRVLRQHWEQQLKTGATDSSGKPVGISIEEAMKKILEQGLPSRSQPGSEQEFPEQEINIPTAASSGRVTRKGKQ